MNFCICRKGFAVKLFVVMIADVVEFLMDLLPMGIRMVKAVVVFLVNPEIYDNIALLFLLHPK